MAAEYDDADNNDNDNNDNNDNNNEFLTADERGRTRIRPRRMLRGKRNS